MFETPEEAVTSKQIATLKKGAQLDLSVKASEVPKQRSQDPGTSKKVPRPCQNIRGQNQV